MMGKLTTGQIEEVLKKQIIGRIGCHADDTTYIVPISYAYDGTYNDIFTVNTDPDVDGLHQWTAPAQVANLWVSYHFANTALKGLGIGFGGNYNGKAYITQSRSYGEFYLPSYTVMNASLSYDSLFTGSV